MSTCHADRTKALQRVAVAGYILTIYRRDAGSDEPYAANCRARIPAAEAECLAAARALVDLADCSD